MVTLDELTRYLDDYLKAQEGRDYGPQGLQVEGKPEVRRIVTGVSACVALFEEAIRRRADAVIVHHGMFWDSDPRPLRGGMKRRIKLLLDHDISLLGYHLALDRHPEVGNNARLASLLELTGAGPFGMYKGEAIGRMGQTARPVTPAMFMAMVHERINPAARAHAFGPGEIYRVAVCSGGAQDLLREAVARGADLYLTGEESEWVYHVAREEGIHYVAAGHHATERLGPMALGDHLAARFGLPVEFVDIPNPI
ncbi:MAG: Nif3-like dinuclear metal center hexameric protein [Nitrospinae bacterium]|nr:Nif3-like dinuclear metal center hexameric protein [Nitrospinota bacterium]